MMSCSKGVTAICVLLLADRGLLDLNAPVAKYWPEFAAAGKSDRSATFSTTVQSCLFSRRGCRVEQPMTSTPWQRRSTASAAVKTRRTGGISRPPQGFLLGEIIYRVTGQSVSNFFHIEFAKPLGLDYWIGLPQSGAVPLR